MRRWRDSIFGTRGEFSFRKSFSLRKKYSLQQQNFVELIFLYFSCYGTMGLPSPFVFFMLLLTLLFVSLILTCLY